MVIDYMLQNGHFFKICRHVIDYMKWVIDYISSLTCVLLFWPYVIDYTLMVIDYISIKTSFSPFLSLASIEQSTLT